MILTSVKCLYLTDKKWCKQALCVDGCYKALFIKFLVRFKMHSYPLTPKVKYLGNLPLEYDQTLWDRNYKNFQFVLSGYACKYIFPMYSHLYNLISSESCTKNRFITNPNIYSFSCGVCQLCRGLINKKKMSCFFNSSGSTTKIFLPCFVRGLVFARHRLHSIVLNILYPVT